MAFSYLVFAVFTIGVAQAYKGFVSQYTILHKNELYDHEQRLMYQSLRVPRPDYVHDCHVNAFSFPYFRSLSTPRDIADHMLQTHGNVSSIRAITIGESVLICSPTKQLAAEASSVIADVIVHYDLRNYIDSDQPRFSNIACDCIAFKGPQDKTHFLPELLRLLGYSASADSAVVSSSSSPATNAASSTESKKSKRKQEKSLFEVAKYLPKCGIGYHMAQSHSVAVSYLITRINIFKDRNHGRAWGIRHKEGLPAAEAPERISGVYERGWKYIKTPSMASQPQLSPSPQPQPKSQPEP